MRLLVQCPNCQQKYDATRRKVGGHFRCRCGSVVQIARPKSHEAAVIHCAGCGGSREAGERSCTYCGSDFTIHELDLNTVCPGCLGRVSDRARYCSHCATSLAVEVIAGQETGLGCPSCADRQLFCRRMGSIATTALECQVCAGLWIGLEAFHDLLTLETRGNRGESVSHRKPGNQPRSGKRYRPCPECRKLMLPRQIGQGGSGIILDVCGEHGLWFDCDELSHLIAWMRNGGLEAVKDDVAALKGSPDAVRKKIHLNQRAPKSASPNRAGGGSTADAFGSGHDSMEESLLLEIGLPLLAAAGRVVAGLFAK